jgi:mercuric ion transport protein
MQDRSTLSLTASVLAGIGASLCCVVPLLLVIAGLGGSWLGSLQAFQPYRPIFVIVALASLGFAYQQIFRRPAACEPGKACADPRVVRRRKLMFWTVTLFVVPLLVFPYLAPLFV